MIRDKIDDFNQPLEVGDKVELHFLTTGMFWLQATQIALIDWQLKGHPHFEILSWSISEPNVVIFTVKVKKPNPVIVTIAVIAAAIVAAGIVFKLTLDSAYKLVNAPVEALKEPGVQAIAGIVALALLGLVLLKFL